MMQMLFLDHDKKLLTNGEKGGRIVLNSRKTVFLSTMIVIFRS